MLPLTELSGQQNVLTSKESGRWLMRGRSLGWPRISGLGDLVGVWWCQSARWRECEDSHCVREAPCHGDLTSKERCPVGPGGYGPGAPWRALGGADRSRRHQCRWRGKSWTAPRRGSGEEGRQERWRSSEAKGGRLVGCHWLPDKGDFRQRLGAEAGLQLV